MDTYEALDIEITNIQRRIRRNFYLKKLVVWWTKFIAVVTVIVVTATAFGWLIAKLTGL